VSGSRWSRALGLGLGLMLAMGSASSILASSVLASPYSELLEALRPDEPLAYFELAEELADEVRSPETLALVRTLYVLAFELSRGEGRESPLAASACLGLAELERLQADRRWLRSLAGMQDARYASRDWNVPSSASSTVEIAYRAATAMGLARAGESRQAQDQLGKPGVIPLMREYERAIGTTGLAGAISRLEKQLRAWPCPECQNRRFLSRQSDEGVQHRLCGTCRGDPGPALSNEEFIGQLAFESVLLNGVQRSWAAEIAVGQGAPLRDPDPAELAPTYRVDPSRPYWRAGQWVGEAQKDGAAAAEKRPDPEPTPAPVVPAQPKKDVPAERGEGGGERKRDGA
jgi:hypothetical protein